MLRSIALPRRVFFMLAAASALSAGCSSIPPSQTSEAAPNTAPASNEAAATRVPPARPSKSTGAMPGDSTPPIPDYDLTGPLLFQLMAAEVAAQRGELGDAYAVFMDLAKKTR